jgi:hypothetical protein
MWQLLFGKHKLQISGKSGRTNNKPYRSVFLKNPASTAAK